MSCPVYYNDSDPFVCQWLKNLIAVGQLPDGEVDSRSIYEVTPDDLRAFTQCHFFAGIGGWAYALTLAEWGDRPIWTGSCPCQPFSTAGKRQAHDDDRHLWPAWFRLIRESRPERIFGEQVAGAAGLGWLDVVSTDLEAEDYAVGAAVLGAHSVGAPHIRQRLWFVADTTERRGWREGGALRPERSSATDRLADAGSERHDGKPVRLRLGEPRQACPETSWGRATGPWDAAEWLPCRDGKARPVEPSIQPLAHGIPNRVGLLRGAGNAIVPQVAAEFVRAYMDVAA